MSQVYFIDGLALGPGYFGFTDPLTNTWRPKKLREGDQAVENKQLLYNVNTSDSGFDSSSTSRTYDAASRTFTTYTTPQSVDVGGNGANSAHVYKSPTGSAITWVVSTDTTDRYIWTSEDGINWKSKGSYYDTDSSPQSVTSTYIALAAGSNASNVTVTSAVVNFGTNGFYLPMDGNSPIGEDKSGNGNDWTPVNFSGTSINPDVVKDSPSGAVSGGRAQTGITTTSSAPANYATLNPLQRSLNRTPTISDGNLSLSLSSGSSEWTNTGCTMSIGSGKYYWEIIWTSIGSGSVARAGVADSGDYEFNRNTAGSGLPWLGSGTGTSWSCDVRGYVYNGGTETTGYTSAFVAGDAMGILLDLDNNTISYMRNGVSGGVAHSNVTSDFVTPGFSLHGATTNSFNVNFGQKPFKYAPPQGFLPLNSASATPETVITHPNQYMNTVTYLSLIHI